MSDAERETVICVNRADAAEGWFSFFTTDGAEYRRLCQRIGGENKLLRNDVGMRGGKPSSWNCRVPIEFLSPRTFAIGARKRKLLTTAQREALGDRLKRARSVKNTQTV